MMATKQITCPEWCEWCEAEKCAKAKKEKDDIISSLSKVNTKLDENIKHLTERSKSMKEQLDEAFEDRENLRIQGVNLATNRSKMIAMELTSFNKVSFFDDNLD